MPTKKRRSKPAASPTIPPPIGELALRFTAQLLEDDKCLRGEKERDNLIGLAFQYVTGWPHQFWIFTRGAQNADPPAVLSRDDWQVFRQMLAQTHEHATHVLMREAESRGLDSSTIWTSSRLARQAILHREKFHLPPGGWHRPWPDCLGVELQSFPEAQRQAIARADAALMRLATILDNEQPEPAPIDVASADDRATGISLRDIALYMNDGDEQAAKETVNRWSDSKRIKAEPIGKCPVDRRKQLYRLPEILADVAGIENLTSREKAAYEKALRAKLRAPHTEQD